jgi:conjugative transfer signal peptidase TraF
MNLAVTLTHKKFLLIPAIFLFIFMVNTQFGIMINTSPSMPLGLYFRIHSAIHRGDIVATCLTLENTQLGLQRHYLKTGQICHGASPLIKQVIAVPGDFVTLTDEYLSVTNKLTNNRYFYRTFYQDRHGKKLRVYPRGKFFSDGYWLLGTHNRYSWDSRYWGPIPRELIIARLIPLLVWP